MKLLECFLCCVSMCGCKDIVTRNVAFYPPRPQGYRIFRMGKSFKIILIDENSNIIHPISVPWIKVIVSTVTTLHKSVIPVVYFKNLYSEFTLLYAHGNSTDIGLMYNFISDLAMQLKVSILIFEYSGYGEATGKPSEQHMYSDIRAAYSFLINQEIEWKFIILYGQSIGSAAVCDLATKVQIAGVILHSPLASGLHFINDNPKKSAWYNAFPNIKKITLIKCPIFIMHGTEDTEIPHTHGEALVCEIKTPWPAWFPKAGHNDIEEKFRKIFLEKITEFLNKIAENKLGPIENSYGSIGLLSDAKKSISAEMESSKVAYTKIIPTNEVCNND
ncbi:hypothetical protein SteCoe_30249 [Stentor coeruleus]|uniref:Serine aminopeptidase S33 domain-containing protein n=1 Tax=Stentor coeruleus TaxID=5963 RepID=A0A1R2B4I9_9CILI|nr:hypothetical protein SteCoe_30249 [Stentor coeruleus]